MTLLAPGSIFWLLRHELRLRFRTVSVGQRSRLIGGIILLAIMHPLGMLVAWGYTMQPPAPGADLVQLSTALLGLGVVLFANSIVQAVQVLYERADFDLLLSSPVPRRTILWVRAGGMAVTIFLSVAWLGLPFANGFILLGDYEAAAAYLWLPALSLLATSLGILATLGLFRLFGPKRTKIAAQIVSIVIGFSAAVVMQSQNTLPPRERALLLAKVAHFATDTIGLDSWLWLPARAAEGETVPLVLVVTLGFGSFALVAGLLADRFTALVVSAGGAPATSASKVPGGSARRFDARLGPLLRRKELLLVWRDPWLLAHIARQMVTVVLIGFMLSRQSIDGTPLIWLLPVVAAGILTSLLAWLTISGEEAPDLIAVAPVRARTVMLAKTEAALQPVILLTLPVAFVAAIERPWLGCTIAVCAAGAALSFAMLQLGSARLRPRKSFALRNRNSIVTYVFEMLLALLWLGVAALMLAGSWTALVVAILPLGTLPRGIVMLRRPRLPSAA